MWVFVSVSVSVSVCAGYASVCMCERGGVVHLHCANFSNLNRQFQSIATAYRFRHEFYFFRTFGCATDAMLAHFKQRRRSVEKAKRSNGETEKFPIH